MNSLMSQIKTYFELVRWKNLLFLAVIHLLLYFAVVVPILQSFGFAQNELSVDYRFILLIFSTLLITAGGYIINDYFDLKIDRINKAGKVIVGELISKKSTMLFYQIITILGLLLGLILAVILRSFSLGLIYILTPGLLWFYSASYKRQFLIGNLIVSLLSALSIIVVAIFSYSVLKINFDKTILQQTLIPYQIFFWIGTFSLFAFLMTWIRELIKDMEDVEGDREMECRTMPIVWGIKKSKIVSSVLISIVIFLLLIAYFFFLKRGDKISSNYTLFALLIPLLFLLYETIRAKTKADFHTASTLSKVIMLLGILYSFLFYFLIAKEFGLLFLGLFIIQ